MELVPVFSHLGLKEDHLKIYLANLEWGETIITNLARKSKVPRTTIYVLIEDLLKIGIITKSMKEGQPLYKACAPEYLQVLLEKRKADLESSVNLLSSNMNNLKAIQNANPKKPKVEFLEGADGIMQAYDRTFEAKSPILIQCLSQNYENIVPKKFMDDYFKRFFKESQIKSKEILADGDDEYISEYGSEKNLQVRIKSEETETDFWVYDDKVVFVSFNVDRPYSLVIEDKGIAIAMKNLYELAWKQAVVEDSRSKKN